MFWPELSSEEAPVVCSSQASNCVVFIYAVHRNFSTLKNAVSGIKRTFEEEEEDDDEERERDKILIVFTNRYQE